MKIIIALVLLSMPIIGFGQTDFIATFQSDNAGHSNNRSVTFPIESATGYQVDFNNDGDLLDAGESTIHTTGFTHDFGVAGTYTIRIVGNLDRIVYNNSPANDEEKIVSIDQWGTASVWTTMEDAFNGCIHLTIPATDAPDLSICTDLTQMFDRALIFNDPIGHWDVGNITTMTSMFRDVDSFNQPLNAWDVSSVTTMNTMFINAISFNQPLNNWDVSNVTTMNGLFRNTPSFNQPLGAWDMSNVRNTNSMFRGATSFNQPLNGWDISNDTITRHMFRDADSFNQPLDSLDVSNVNDMGLMFMDNDIFNQPLNMWDVSKVTNMIDMFRRAIAFDQPLDAWDVSSVTNMTNTFRDATAFNQPLDAWDVSSVSNMSSTFRDATAFNQPLDAWDVSSVTNMSSTFRDATAFNQRLNNWDISSVTTMNHMFSDSGLDCVNYDSTLIGWEAQGITGIPLVATGLVYDESLAARTSLTTTYSWTISGDSYISGCHAAALPIELLSFNAHLRDNKVYIDWQTAIEINNDYFIVQRSKDGINWTDLLEVEGAGNSIKVLSYSAVDFQPVTGVSYYRLKQYDYDGAFSESFIVALEHSEIDGFYVYPNPTNGPITTASTGSEEEFSIEIMNLTGKVIGAATTAINGSESAIAHLENYQSGIYLIRLFNKTNEKTFRVVKQ